MDFGLTEEQRLLVDNAASFLKKHSPVARLRSLRADAIGWSRQMWRQMAELGWLGVSFPEEVGGLGASFLEASLILEQLGVSLAPEPFIPHLVAGHAILRAGTTEQRRRWLLPAIEGRTSLALAALEAQSRSDVTDVTTTAVRVGAGYRLDGVKRWVLNGHAAGSLVVSARLPGSLALFVVDREGAGVKVQPVKTMDGHHAAMVTFAGAEVGEERRLGTADAAEVLFECADIGAAAACAEGHGIMRTALAMTVDYLRTREQFGVKIGTFQALQHRAVDMFVETELARSMAILAALRVEDKDRAARESAISAAKVQLAVGGRLVTQQAIQLHGGIGVTDEHDIGLYFKRMHVLNSLFGDEEHHLARFAAAPAFVEGIE